MPSNHCLTRACLLSDKICRSNFQPILVCHRAPLPASSSWSCWPSSAESPSSSSGGHVRTKWKSSSASETGRWPRRRDEMSTVPASRTCRTTPTTPTQTGHSTTSFERLIFSLAVHCLAVAYVVIIIWPVSLRILFAVTYYVVFVIIKLLSLLIKLFVLVKLVC